MNRCSLAIVLLVCAVGLSAPIGAATYVYRNEKGERVRELPRRERAESDRPAARAEERPARRPETDGVRLRGQPALIEIRRETSDRAVPGKDKEFRKDDSERNIRR